MSVSISPNNITCSSGDLAIKLQPGNILSLANNAINCGPIVASDGSFNTLNVETLNVKTLNAGSLVVPDDTFADITATTISLGGSASSVSVNSSSIMWNISAGSGETDFVNQYGTGGVGGYNFYAIGGSNATYPLSSQMSPIVKIDRDGNTNVNTLSITSAVGAVNGNATTIMFGYEGIGETDFVNEYGDRYGGFNFYSMGTHNNLSTTDPIVKIDPCGNITAKGDLHVDGFIDGVINNPGFTFLPIDIPKNYAQNWTEVSGILVHPSWATITWGSTIAMSSSGQYQIASGLSNDNSGGTTPLIAFIYVSTNFGASWTVSFDPYPNHPYDVNASSMAVSATGQYQLAGYPNGYLIKSNAYGTSSSTTWIRENFIPGGAITSVAMSASGKYQAVYGNNNNSACLYISSDYGSSWVLSNATTANTIIDASAVAMSSSGQYIAISGVRNISTLNPTTDKYVFPGCICISNDYGSSMTVSYTDLNGSYIANSIAMSASGQYITATYDANLVLVSNNYGTTWTPNQPNSTNFSDYVSVSMSDSGQYQTVATTTSNLIYYSTNYGVNWSSSTTNTKYNALAVSASGQFQTGVYGGVIGGSGSIYTCNITNSPASSTSPINTDLSGNITCLSLTTTSGTAGTGTVTTGTVNAGTVTTGNVTATGTVTAGNVTTTSTGTVSTGTINVISSVPTVNGIASVNGNSTTIMFDYEGIGESDFVNEYGDRSGGFHFYSMGANNNLVTTDPIVKIDPCGNITAKGDLHVDGFIDGVINNQGFTFLPIDILANYARTWTTVSVVAPNSNGPITFGAIAMSSSGQYQTTYGVYFVDGLNIGFIFVSTNFGASWHITFDSYTVRVGTSYTLNASSIAVSATGQYQLAGYSNGYLIQSNNYGYGVYASSYITTWNYVDLIQGGSITSVAMSASGKYQAVYGNNNNSACLYISSDYGSSWVLSNATNSLTDASGAVAMSSSGQHIAISAVKKSTGNGCIFISNDYGSSVKQSLDTNGNYVADSIAISASGQYISAAYSAGSIWVFNSNQQPQWVLYDFGSGNPIISVSMSASGQYQTAAATNGLVFYSTNYGVNWSSKTTNTPYTAVAVSASGQFQTGVSGGSNIYTCNITNSTASSSPVNTDTSGNIICTSLTTTGTAGVTTGVVSATTVSTGYVNSGYLSVNTSTPNVGLSSGLIQGSYMMWNASGGTAETDFVNIVPNSGIYNDSANAGFKFFNVFDTSGAGWYGIHTPIAQIHSDGTFVCNAINVGGHSIVSNSSEDLSFQGGSVTIKGYGYFNTSEMNTQLGTELVDISSNNYGLLVQYRIACGAEVDVFSDKRIKNNILDISSEDSLNQVRKLQPKTFKYIDNTVNSKINYGFIAQDVYEVFSEGVTKIKNYIPNIFQQATISNKNIITFINFSTSDMLNDSNKIKLTVKDKEEIVTIKEILDEHSFSINEDILDETCFVYGQEVNDLHVLEKNAIFTLTTSAVKQLDAELQELKQINENQQNEIEILKKEFDELKQLLLSKITE